MQANLNAKLDAFVFMQFFSACLVSKEEKRERPSYLLTHAKTI